MIIFTQSRVVIFHIKPFTHKKCTYPPWRDLGKHILLPCIWMESIQFCISNNTDKSTYRQVSNIRRTLIGNKIVDHSDVVGASPVGAAPTTSSFST